MYYLLFWYITVKYDDVDGLKALRILRFCNVANEVSSQIFSAVDFACLSRQTRKQI